MLLEIYSKTYFIFAESLILTIFAKKFGQHN